MQCRSSCQLLTIGQAVAGTCCQRRLFSHGHRAYQQKTLTTFADLGLPTELCHALAQSFPYIKHPTPSQIALIQTLIDPASPRRKDAATRIDTAATDRSLILRDVTGSGKSFALMLGLLSTALTSKPSSSLQSLLLVPHTELARQYERWLTALMRALSTEGSVKPPESPWQVLYRGAARKELSQTANLLVATPNAMLDVLPGLSSGRTAGIQTIALDEADDMLSLPPRFATAQQTRKWERHPPVLIALVADLLAQKPATVARRTPVKSNKRIVAVSATANAVLRDWIVRRSGWVGERGVLGTKQIDWYDFTGSLSEIQDTGTGQSVYQQVGAGLLPSVSLRHSLVPIDGQGRLTSEEAPSKIEATTSRCDELVQTVLAASAIFAEQQVKRGLLLIPSKFSMAKVLWHLNDVYVPACEITDSNLTDLTPDEPRLYVHSVNGVRGLHIPDLEHVIVAPGLVKDAHDYLHIAGRVGRMSTNDASRQAGQVICLANADSASEVRQVKRCWELLGIDGQVGV